MMKRLKSYFHSRVGRRIFLVFLVCTILPVTVLAVVSYYRVADQLEDQARHRLRQTGRNVGLLLHGQLMVLHQELHLLAHSYQADPSTFPARFASLGLDLRQPLTSLTLFTEEAVPTLLSGEKNSGWQPPPAEVLRRMGENAILWIPADGPHELAIYLAVRLDPASSATGLLWAEISPSVLIEKAAEALPPHINIFVATSRGQRLYAPPLHRQKRPLAANPTVSGQSVASLCGDRNCMADQVAVSLRDSFDEDDWIITLHEPREVSLVSLYSFRRTFYLVAAVSLWSVLLVSAIFIRRSLVPLQRLKEGTRRLGRGDFSQAVEVDSADEFAELAQSFNAMATELDNQFYTLDEMGQTTRAILVALDREKLVQAVLTRLPRIVRCDCLGLTLAEGQQNQFSTFLAAPAREQTATEEKHTCLLEATEIQALGEIEDAFFTEAADILPNLLDPLARRGTGSFFILPIHQNGSIQGALLLGYRTAPHLSREDRVRARAIADQITVALANIRLIEELADLNYGTLTALARTVDAKSSWTAGHSERVTSLALAIGRTLGLSAGDLDLLHRASLLHDIGKIGVPNAILEKPIPLNPVEYSVINTHPEKGVRILEPIQAYRDVLPIVEQHHEWFNGQGYPRGLQGEEIAPGARILAVADVYDALISDRPYRRGWPHDEVMAHLQKGSGQQFDPEVVHAFMRTVSSAAYPA
ncbi:HD domain-containing phosphohydrolase [Desulfuromonas sp. AOP6]|uniref:HD domain-containing phosphohydrolase n=1 Tax=Desulfuromonas sp. AOP6 TaxID=1566351 RepID=UPI001BCD8DAB|nr:HD domain-containing phosphohydrolase [Desulfuromonas sp. AOP6]